MEQTELEAGAEAAGIHRRGVNSLILIVPLLLLAPLCVFWPVVHAGFIGWDDNIHIFENPYFLPISAAHLRHLWLHAYEQLYIPVSYTVFALLAASSHLPATAAAASDAGLLFNPHPFHWANLLIHDLNVLLVFAILRRLVKSDAAASGGALLFALHPVQVESVAWISELRGTLCGLFSLLALRQYLGYAAGEVDGISPKRRQWHLLSASVAFVLALLCKPAAVAVPLMAGVLQWYALRPAKLSSFLPLIGWALPAGLDIVLTRFVQSVPAAIVTPLWARPLIMGDALAFYLAKLVLPIKLAPDYGRTPAFVLGHVWGYLTWLIPAGLALMVWRFRKRNPWLAASGALFIGWLLPVLGLIPFGFQTYSTVADRYLYLAMLGPALALAYLLSRFRSKAFWGCCLAGLACCALLDAVQVRLWDNTARLFRHTLSVNPRSWTALDRLGQSEDKQGKPQEAIAIYRQALAIKPDAAYTQSNLGKVLTDQGNWNEAITHLSAAIQLKPDLAGAHYNLGRALLLQGKADAAAAQFMIALRLQPELPLVWNNLGVALMQQGKIPQAIACYRQALRINPDVRDAQYDLGNALAAQGDLEAAEACYRQVLLLTPDDTDAHFNLGALLCRQGRMAEAVPEMEAVLSEQPNDVPAHYYLGVAEATLGDTQEAMAQLREALRINPQFVDARRVISLLQAHPAHP